MIQVEEIPALFNAFRQRWQDRDERVILTDQVVAGDLSVLGPDDEALINRSPNMIQVGIEDTAEAASMLPTVRIVPSGVTDTAKKKSEKMERIAASYLDRSQFELLNIQSLMELVGFGYHTWVIVHDKEAGGPVIEWRDPRTCFPEPGWRPGDSVRTCMFAREVYLRQLPAEHQAKVQAKFAQVEPLDRTNVNFLDHKVTLIDVFDEDQILLVAMYHSSLRAGGHGTYSWVPVELERTKTPGGICPVVIGQRITLDGQPRGQFDQVINVLQSHVRLMGLILDYADQAVYSDVWVKDLLGQMPYGGGSFIQLGPQGQIGRVPPAVTSFAVESQLQQLIDNIHLGGRWPKSRPGEIDQAIASAKFIEATAGMMNTVIRTLHLIMKRSLEQAIRICFMVDAEVGVDRTVAGVLRNQQFQIARDRSDIDLKARVLVDFGIGLGRDPAQTLVLGIQGMQTGLFSTEFVQENFDGLTDVAKERKRIDVQQLRDMAFAQLLQGLQDKSIPPSALVDIAKEREGGADIFALFDKFVVQPQQAVQDQMIPSGLGGPGMMPGADPALAAGGPTPPPPPEAAGLLAALGGGGAPPGGPPPEPESIGRLSIPLPGGGFAGTQSTG
jgi:hypothetical protein